MLHKNYIFLMYYRFSKKTPVNQKVGYKFWIVFYERFKTEGNSINQLYRTHHLKLES